MSPKDKKSTVVQSKNVAVAVPQVAAETFGYKSELFAHTNPALTANPSLSEKNLEVKPDWPRGSNKHYNWREHHQQTLLEFWRSNPIFYDKSLQHYKNKKVMREVIQGFIDKQCQEWKKIDGCLPTVIQVQSHLRNMRTRYVKLVKRLHDNPGCTLSHTDQRIMDRYNFLRPHIRSHNIIGPPTLLRRSSRERSSTEADQNLWTSELIDEIVSFETDSNENKQDDEAATSTTSAHNHQEDTTENQVMQQAKELISHIKSPSRIEHETRVREFSRYIETELRRVPESAWDDCTLTIMTVIRSFKTGQAPAT